MFDVKAIIESRTARQASEPNHVKYISARTSEARLKELTETQRSSMPRLVANLPILSNAY